MTTPEQTSVEGLRFTTAHPVLAMQDRWDEIQALREGFYDREFTAGAPEGAAEGFVGRTTPEIWCNLNASPHLRGRYRHPRVVSAYDAEGALVGFAYGANNASTTHSGLVGELELVGKLHVPTPRFINRRYLNLHEVVGPDEVVIGALAVLLTDSYLGAQPVRAYPYAEEWSLTARLGSWGFSQTYEHPEGVPEAFGPGTRETRQARYVAPRADKVAERIAERYPQATAQARVNHERVTTTGLAFPEPHTELL